MHKINHANINKTDTCWLWTGSHNGVGYGEVRINNKKKYVHRLMYENYKGEIPTGYQIDHLCRVPACCNPGHLEAVTPQENVLRGDGAKPKPYMLKTHCSQGHEYTELNSYIRKDGKGRNCVECVRKRSREYQQRKRRLCTV